MAKKIYAAVLAIVGFLGLALIIMITPIKLVLTLMLYCILMGFIMSWGEIISIREKIDENKQSIQALDSNTNINDEIQKSLLEDMEKWNRRYFKYR